MSENVKRYAHMDGDLVTNVSLWDGESPFDPRCKLIELPDDSPVGPGWIRDGNDWVKPLPTAEELAAQEEAEAAADEAAAEAAARDAAIAHAKSLGFTDEMIAVMYPGLTV